MRYVILAVIFSFSIIFLPSSFSKDEFITLTTYYPSPVGIYHTLRLSPGEPAKNPKEGDMYYDINEHTFKFYDSSKWSGVVWFRNVGIFLKEGAKASSDFSIENLKFFGDAKYEKGKIYTRVKILTKANKKVCDSGWKEEFSNKCNYKDGKVHLLTDTRGVHIWFKCNLPCIFYSDRHLQSIGQGPHTHYASQGYWR